MLDTTEPTTTPPRAAKVGHKKSRLGCQRCKTRRVKCDEQKPICSSCQRHGAQCVYVEPRSARLSPVDSTDSQQKQCSPCQMSIQSRASSSPSSELFPRTLFETDDIQVPESKARRLMELRLAQNFLLNIKPSTHQCNPSPDWLLLWRDIMPQFVLTHDCVLYASHAFSATHLLRTIPDDEALYSARQNYLVLALREQRKQVLRISTENADAVCLTSMLILLTSFGMMQDRDLSVYTPPIDWLKLGRGAGAVMKKANNSVPPEFPAVFKALINAHSARGLNDPSESRLEPAFAAIWHTMCDHEDWDVETQEIYRRPLAYISMLQRSVEDKGAPFVLGRGLHAFTMAVPPRFADLIEMQDTCALIVLAHYFGVVAQMPAEVWWRKGEKEYNGTMRREIYAIHDFIPSDWRDLMQWPLSTVAYTCEESTSDTPDLKTEYSLPIRQY